jgi:hypothetical protein
VNWRRPKSFLYPRRNSLQERKIHRAMRLAPEKGSVFKEVYNQLDFCLRLLSTAASFYINRALTDNS